VKVAPRYAPALGGVSAVTEVEVGPCEISGVYFTRTVKDLVFKVNKGEKEYFSG
jgi:hypothetical protein